VAVLATLMAARRGPLAAGLKLTVTVHVAPAASVLGDSGHVVLIGKSPGFVPIMLTLLSASALVPMFVTVMVSGLLVVPTVWGEKP
jgi:hypothetical protein